MRVLGTGTEADEPLTMSAAARELAELMRQYRAKGWGPVEEGGPPGFVKVVLEREHKELCLDCKHFKPDQHRYPGPLHSHDCTWKQRGTHANTKACKGYQDR